MVNMIRKGQVRWLPKGGIAGPGVFIGGLLGLVALVIQRCSACSQAPHDPQDVRPIHGMEMMSASSFEESPRDFNARDAGCQSFAEATAEARHQQPRY